MLFLPFDVDFSASKVSDLSINVFSAGKLISFLWKTIHLQCFGALVEFFDVVALKLSFFVKILITRR